MTPDSPMSHCADSTALRTHLDHPDPRLEAHLDGCATCTGLLRAVAADVGATRRALDLLDEPGAGVPAVDVEAALTAATRPVPAAPAPTGADVTPLPRRRSGRRAGRPAGLARRLALSGAAAALVLAVAITPTGRSAVAQALDAFRGERLQVVTFDPAALGAGVEPEDVLALQALGDIDTAGLSEPGPVADVAQAEAVAGIQAPSLDGVLDDAPDELAAMAPGTARLTLVAREGNGVPADLDGAVLLVDVPGAIGAIYAHDDGAPELIIGRSGPLAVRAEGAPLEDVRAFLLSREELPADLRDQLAAIGDWRSTIPVPVPLDGPGWEEVEVAGRQAIAFGDGSGLGALVIRQDPDGVTVVAGRIAVDRALEIAAGA